MTGRSVIYTSSPLLASRTPVWRSKFIVGALAVSFLAGVAATRHPRQEVGPPQPGSEGVDLEAFAEGLRGQQRHGVDRAGGSRHGLSLATIILAFLPRDTTSS